MPLTRSPAATSLGFAFFAATSASSSLPPSSSSSLSSSSSTALGKLGGFLRFSLSCRLTCLKKATYRVLSDTTSSITSGITGHHRAKGNASPDEDERLEQPLEEP